MNSDYKNNHYVPIWYQKKFMRDDQNELFYLDLKPTTHISEGGVKYKSKSLYIQGPKKCFMKEDLYTQNIRGILTRDIEKYFFGKLDIEGKKSLEKWIQFNYQNMGESDFRSFLSYMSSQKVRTPKGIKWLNEVTNIKNRSLLLRKMMSIKDMHCAIWTECIWQIADASNSEVKFIISDHPVTVYNRVCGPKSFHCKDYKDPDIRLNGTHTIFPLSMNKILILTNLSWVRNPYQSEVLPRPNPRLFREAIFNFTDVQTERKMTQDEVIQINYIIKRRAYKYIAASKKEWLFPEKNLPPDNWRYFGEGYLFMPDPRFVSFAGETYIGHSDGTSSAFDEYGRRGWDRDFGYKKMRDIEAKTLYRFQGEFSKLYGQNLRGKTFTYGNNNVKVDDEWFKNLLTFEKKYKGRINKT